MSDTVLLSRSCAEAANANGQAATRVDGGIVNRACQLLAGQELSILFRVPVEESVVSLLDDERDNRVAPFEERVDIPRLKVRPDFPFERRAIELLETVEYLTITPCDVSRCLQAGKIAKRPGVVDRPDVPVVGDDQVPKVAVDVVNQLVEQPYELHPAVPAVPRPG